MKKNIKIIALFFLFYASIGYAQDINQTFSSQVLNTGIEHTIGNAPAIGNNWTTYSGCDKEFLGGEVIYSFIPNETGNYAFYTKAIDGRATFFLMDECNNNAQNIYGDELIGGEIVVSLIAGHTYYLIIDNKSNVESAEYVVSVNPTDKAVTVPNAPILKVSFPDCDNAQPFCTGANYAFPAITGQSDSQSIGCLGTVPNGTWFWMEMLDPGPVTIHMEGWTGSTQGSGSSKDIDYIAWGPFPSLTDGCATMHYGSSQPYSVSCSYSASYQENCNIPSNAQSGDVYILLITNYSASSCNVFFSQTQSAGSGTTNCSIIVEAANNGPLCVGEAIELWVVTPPNNPVYHWSGPNGFDSNQATPIITAPYLPTTPGSYTYTVTVTSTGTGFNGIDTTTVIITPSPNPQIVAYPGPVITCSASQITLTATDGESFLWNTNATTQSISVANVGNYEVTASNSIGCSATAAITITNIVHPTSSFTVTPIMCYGNSSIITYTGNMTEPQSYVNFIWDFDGGTIIQGSGMGPYHVAWGDAGIHPVSLTVSNYDCFSIPTIINVYNPPLLKMNLNFSNISCFGKCDGSATAIVTGGTAPYNYSWNSGTSINMNMCADSYQLIVTDVNGCTTWNNFSIVEPDELIIYQSSFNNLTCYNANNGSINIVHQGGTPPYQYQWSDGAMSLNRLNIPAGNYTITIIDAHGCSVSKNFIITQPEELLVTINNNMTICEGQQAIIQANGQGGTLPYNYYWSKTPFPNNYFVENQSLTETPDTTTIYRVFIHDDNGCNSNTAMMKITVSPDLVIDNLFTVNNSCYQSCDGKATALFHGGFPPYNFSWGSNSYQLFDLCKGAYSLTITDAVGCHESTTFIIEEPEKIQYSKDSTDVLCFGGSDGTATIQIQSGTGTPPYTYKWPDGQTTYYVNNLPAGNFIVTVTDLNNCKTMVPFTIEQPNELYTQNIPNRTVCSGQHVQLITQSIGGTQYYEYQWKNSLDETHFSNTWDVNPTQTTTYYLTVTDNNGCTYSPLPTTITVNPPVQITYIQSNPYLICPGQETEITVTVIGGNGGPYLMKTQDGTIVGSPFTVAPLETTTYIVSVEDMCGSQNAEASIKVEVRPSALKNFTAFPTIGCSPLDVQFEDQSETIFDQYLWDFGDNVFSTERNATHTYTIPGTYDVTFEIRDSLGCTYKKHAPQLITVHPVPQSLFSMSTEVISLLNSEVIFTNFSEGAIKYYWSFGDGDSSNYINPSHFYIPDTLLYQVILVAENDKNCKHTSWHNITVANMCEFYMPSSFTPNNDQKNDCFKPCASGISSANFLLLVKDRWGNIVFKTNTFIPTNSNKDCDSCTDGAWNGRMNNTGNILQNGTYVWHCEYEDQYGIKYTREGTVTLIR